VGWAFKSVNEGQEKTNLYVFLTPRLVRNTDEAKKIYKEKKEAVAPLMEEAEINLYNTVDEMGKKLSGKGEKQTP
jgi:general secretion pathway protein D